MVEGNSLAQYGQVLSQKYSITARPRTSSSETGLPPSAASLNGAGRWSPSGVTWNAESRSSRLSLAAAGSRATATRTSAPASLRLDVRVARLLELHDPHDSTRHRSRALDQILQLDLLARHRI